LGELGDRAGHVSDARGPGFLRHRVRASAACSGGGLGERRIERRDEVVGSRGDPAHVGVAHHLGDGRRDHGQTGGQVLTQLERIYKLHALIDSVGDHAGVEPLAISGQLVVALLTQQVHVRDPVQRRQIPEGLADQRDRPGGPRARDVRDQREVDPVAQRAVEPDPRVGQRLEVGGHGEGRIERAGEHRVIDPVRRDEGLAVDLALGVGQRVIDREHGVDPLEHTALGGDGLGPVEVREHRPLIDAVVHGELLAERADVVRRVGQERPELEQPDAQPQAQRADRGAQDLAVDRARDRAARERQDQRRGDPQVVLDVDRTARELGELALDLAEVTARPQARRAGRERVEPQHAAGARELAQHVVVRGGILVPVLGKGDDR